MALLSARGLEHDVPARLLFPRALEHQPLNTPSWGHEMPGDITPQGWLLGAWAGTEQATALLWETSLCQALGDSPG